MENHCKPDDELAQARERLEKRLRPGRLSQHCHIECADLRIVLDALREARRQAFEEIASHLEGMGWSRPMGGYDAAQLIRALAAKEQS
jgi:hypothetical protein